MDASTPLAVRRMKVNKKEKDHKSRMRLGFHVYLSRFFYDFNKLELEKQHEYIFYNGGNRLGKFRCIAGDDVSVDSTNSLFTEKAPRLLIHQSACFRWRYILTQQTKKSWNSRAKTLNNRKLPGKFLGIPWKADKSKNNIEEKVLQSLSYDWDVVVSFFKNCITRTPKKLISSMIYTFGKEKVQVGSQTYRDFRISYLIELAIFGRDCSLMDSSKEIILKSKKQALLHIASQKRMKQLFSKENLDATEYMTEKNNIKYTQTCCGKLNIVYNNKNINGYILDESRGKWKILLASNKIIFKKPLVYNRESRKYIYPSTRKYIINHYRPIRVLLKINGKGLRLTINRLAY